ncbi:hypothetical protein V5O48_016463, partial [Marasmius crinis-equi]
MRAPSSFGPSLRCPKSTSGSRERTSMTRRDDGGESKGSQRRRWSTFSSPIVSQSALDNVLEVGDGLLDKDLFPDLILQRVIRAIPRQRFCYINHGSFQANHAAKMDWVARVKVRFSIADLTEKANEQHCEVPTEFILSTLSLYEKYSSCLYPTEMLIIESYCEKTKLVDVLDVLDLGY